MQYFRAMLEISIQIHPHPKIPLQKLNTIKQTLNSSPFSSAKSYQTHYFNSAVRAAQMPRVAASVTTSAWGPRLRKLWATKPKPWCENVSVHWAYPQSASEPWQLNIHQLVPSLMMFTFPARKKKHPLNLGCLPHLLRLLVNTQSLRPDAWQFSVWVTWFFSPGPLGKT